MRAWSLKVVCCLNLCPSQKSIGANKRPTELHQKYGHSFNEQCNLIFDFFAIFIQFLSAFAPRRLQVFPSLLSLLPQVVTPIALFFWVEHQFTLTSYLSITAQRLLIENAFCSKSIYLFGFLNWASRKWDDLFHQIDLLVNILLSPSIGLSVVRSTSAQFVQLFHVEKLASLVTAVHSDASGRVLRLNWISSGVFFGWKIRHNEQGKIWSELMLNAENCHVWLRNDATGTEDCLKTKLQEMTG